MKWTWHRGEPEGSDDHATIDLGHDILRIDMEACPRCGAIVRMKFTNDKSDYTLAEIDTRTIHTNSHVLLDKALIGFGGDK